MILFGAFSYTSIVPSVVWPRRIWRIWTVGTSLKTFLVSSIVIWRGWASAHITGSFDTCSLHRSEVCPQLGVAFSEAEWDSLTYIVGAQWLILWDDRKSVWFTMLSGSLFFSAAWITTRKHFFIFAFSALRPGHTFRSLLREGFRFFGVGCGPGLLRLDGTSVGSYSPSCFSLMDDMDFLTNDWSYEDRYWSRRRDLA